MKKNLIFPSLFCSLLYCSANHQLDGCLPEPANKVCSSDPPSVIQSVRLSGRHASSQSLLLAKSTSIPLLTFFSFFLVSKIALHYYVSITLKDRSCKERWRWCWSWSILTTWTGAPSYNTNRNRQARGTLRNQQPTTFAFVRRFRLLDFSPFLQRILLLQSSRERSRSVCLIWPT